MLYCRVTNHCNNSSQLCSLGRTSQRQLGTPRLHTQPKAGSGHAVLLHVACPHLAVWPGVVCSGAAGFQESKSRGYWAYGWAWNWPSHFCCFPLLKARHRLAQMQGPGKQPLPLDGGVTGTYRRGRAVASHLRRHWFALHKKFYHQPWALYHCVVA